jgi:ubiquinone/menaquinone biosynthesis C-methylase UbiE
MKNIKEKIKNSMFKYFSFLDNEEFRNKWVVSKLKEIPEGKSLLDAGAGECRYKKYCSQVKYKSQDFCEYEGSGDGVGLQTNSWDTKSIDIVSDVVNIPVDSGSFDYVLCTEVLEHVPYPDKAIAEFSRILRRGGRLILTAPFSSQTHFAPFHFSTGFNSYWYKEVLNKEGFKILEMKANGNYFDYVCQELIRTPFMFKKHSKLSYLSYLLYVIIIPMVFIIFMLSKLSRNSEEQLTFGFHVLAEKLV